VRRGGRGTWLLELEDTFNKEGSGMRERKGKEKNRGLIRQTSRCFVDPKKREVAKGEGLRNKQGKTRFRTSRKSQPP